jgi:hypothetical protein
MENNFDENSVMSAFEALAARLDSLDGMYAWDNEIEMIREALKRAGNN